MAFAKVILENPLSGKIRTAPIGFSWTVLFFSFFPALFRSDWKWFVIMLILGICTWYTSSLVFMFIYNRLYIRELLEDGYRVTSISGADIDRVSRKVGYNLHDFMKTPQGLVVRT